MKYIDTLFYSDIKPDEKSFKESLLIMLTDHFCLEKLTFILTRDVHNLPEFGPNVIVFLSGNESSSNPTYANKVGLIYTDFWNPTMSSNVKSIPLGHNERSEGSFLGHESVPLISERAVDVYFAGALHSENSHRRTMIKKMKMLCPSIKQNLFTYTDFFFGAFNSPENREAKNKEFKNYLKNSKICLCPGGYWSQNSNLSYFPGWESYRFGEAMRAGSLIITNFNWCKWYQAPNVFSIPSWNDLTTDLIKDILNLDVNAIQLEAKRYYRKKLSRSVILQEIIHDIESIILTKT